MSVTRTVVTVISLKHATDAYYSDNNRSVPLVLKIVIGAYDCYVSALRLNVFGIL